jgi:hypothetical protein
MSITKCPGQNSMFWKPEDVTETTCPKCGGTVEFFKDDAKRSCPGCGKIYANPKLNTGCREWCKVADKCTILQEADADNIEQKQQDQQDEQDGDSK